jgi:uncharacterized membrane protein YdbT with pleckstrin-like domain
MGKSVVTRTFRGAKLRLETDGGRNSYALSTGLSETVGAADREEIAALVAAHMKLSHEEAYAVCWLFGAEGET